MGTVCGIDLGTQSCKLVVYDPGTGTVVARSRAGLDLIARDDGTREQEASWYAEAVRACFAAIPAGLRSSIEAVGVSGQQHGFVSLDAGGRPIAPVKLWCDTSTVAECAELTAAAGGAEVLLRETGMPMLPGYTAPKVLRLKKRHPEAFARLRHVLLPHDYVNYLLTGTFFAEAGDASGTALFDVRSRRWSAFACSLVDPGLEALLPPLVEPGAVAGRVSAAAAAAFGIAEGIPVAPGGGDNMMGAIGAGCIRDGFLVASLGTSGTLFGYSDVPVVDPSGALAAFCSSTGGWLPLLCTMNCTVATESWRNILGLDVRAFDAEAARAPAGAGGLAVLPFFNGERFPDLPAARASLEGATASNFTRANVARAAMEAAVFGLRAGLDAFRALGFAAREVRLVGGGAKSRLWRSIVADVLGLPVAVPAEEESAAFGAALQALWCLGRLADPDATMEAVCGARVVLDEASRADPDPASAAAYEDAYASYRKYLGALAPLYR